MIKKNKQGSSGALAGNLAKILNSLGKTNHKRDRVSQSSSLDIRTKNIESFNEQQEFDQIVSNMSFKNENHHPNSTMISSYEDSESIPNQFKVNTNFDKNMIPQRDSNKSRLSRVSCSKKSKNK